VPSRLSEKTEKYQRSRSGHNGKEKRTGRRGLPRVIKVKTSVESFFSISIFLALPTFFKTFRLL
jgi:hypothetical protein